MNIKPEGVSSAAARPARVDFRRPALALAMHLGALSAPFYYSPSGLMLAGVLFALTGLGVSVGLHRLLTHRSFRAYRWVERAFAMLGALAFQGGVIEWVALHRIHHAHSDTQDDPHTPRWGFWWGHMLWLTRYDERIADWSIRERWVKDLAKDRFLLFLERWSIPLQVCVFLMLYGLGELYQPGLGGSWAVYGVFVRFVALQQVTWLVNSVSHKWGYQRADTGDASRNNWLVALLTFGEGWHNNHHAMPRSANFSRRWFEFDPGFLVISLLARVGLAWDVVVPRPVAAGGFTGFVSGGDQAGPRSD